MRRKGRRQRAPAAPAGERSAPLIALCEELQDRQNGLWWSSHSFSLAIHALVVAWVIQTGVILVDYSMRFGAGYPFGQAVMLASPLFELGQRGSLRGRGREIPLSALVPERKLYEPDLRSLLKRPQPTPAAAGPEDPPSPEAAISGPTSSSSVLPIAGGGGALPGGTLPERIGAGPATPFDLVPPSNTRARRPGERIAVRVRVGDAGVPGGGSAEGLRLPPSAARVGISAEAQVEQEDGAVVETWLRTIVSRLRRASFEWLPDRRDLGAPGLVTLAFECDPSGRMIRPRVATPSGNAALDRLALALLQSIPFDQPLQQSALAGPVTVHVRVRYFPPR